MRKSVLGMVVGMIGVTVAGLSGCGQESCLEDIALMSKDRAGSPLSEGPERALAKSEHLIWSTEERGGPAKMVKGVSAMAAKTGDLPDSSENWAMQSLPGTTGQTGVSLPVFVDRGSSGMTQAGAHTASGSADNTGRLGDLAEAIGDSMGQMKGVQPIPAMDELLAEVTGGTNGGATGMKTAPAKRAENATSASAETELDEGLPQTKKNADTRDTFENQDLNALVPATESLQDAQLLSRKIREQLGRPGVTAPAIETVAAKPMNIVAPTTDAKKDQTPVADAKSKSGVPTLDEFSIGTDILLPDVATGATAAKSEAGAEQGKAAQAGAAVNAVTNNNAFARKPVVPAEITVSADDVKNAEAEKLNEQMELLKIAQKLNNVTAEDKSVPAVSALAGQDRSANINSVTTSDKVEAAAAGKEAVPAEKKTEPKTESSAKIEPIASIEEPSIEEDFKVIAKPVVAATKTEQKPVEAKAEEKKDAPAEPVAKSEEKKTGDEFDAFLSEKPAEAVKPAATEAVKTDVAATEAPVAQKTEQTSVAKAAKGDAGWVDEMLDAPELPAAPAPAVVAEEAAAKPEEKKEAEKAQPVAAEKKEEAKAEEKPAAATATEVKTPVAEATSPAPAAAVSVPVAGDVKQDLVKLEKIRQEARAVEAKNFLDTGIGYFNAGQYQEALNFFEKALQVDPSMKEAASFRTRSRQLLGRADGGKDDAQMIDEITRTQSARLRERELRINSCLEKASGFYVSAINPDATRKVLGRVEQIKAGLDDLDLAMKEVQSAETLLQGAGLPKSAEKTLDMRIKALKAQITESGKDLVAERAMLDRQEAERKARESGQQVSARQAREIEQMFAGVDYYYKRTEYEKALDLLAKIKAEDPTNARADEMRDKIRTSYHQDTAVETTKELSMAEDNWAIDIKEAKIMPRKMLIYPLDWERVQQRARVQNLGGAVDFEKQRILNALAAVTGSVEYNELPLNMVLDDFRRRTKVNIMLNQEVDGEQAVTITLRDISLLTAFETVLSQQKLEYTVKDQAIEIFEKGATGSSDILLKIYQVADLTTPKKNYYAPKLNKDSDSDFGGDDDDDDDDEDEWKSTPIDLPAMISAYVPGSWDDKEKYSVELWEDNLLVKATPEMQSKVNKYLDDLRKSSKLQVFVEGRFMTITDKLQEMFGFDWNSTYAYSNDSGSRQVQSGLSVNPTFSPSGVMHTTEDDALGAQTTIDQLWRKASPLSNLLDALHLKLVVNAAQTSTKGSVLHNPKVLVANGRNAYARVIVTKPYFTNYTISGSTLLPVMIDVAQGVTWEARPIVSFDHKYITVRVRPKIEEIDTTYELVQNMTVATSDGDASSQWRVTLRNPVTRITQFETNATVPDGGTILIGGQLQETASERVTGIPVMSSLPYAGRLFRSNYDNRNGTNRVIMVSAKIVELED